MPDPSTVILFTSVIILVVMELSQMVRTENIHDLAIDSRGVPYIPKIGLFSIVHVVNYTLLGAGLFIASTTPFQGNMATLLVISFVYLLLMSILPYIEYEGFDRHISRTSNPKSHKYHFILVMITFFGPIVVMSVMIGIFDFYPDQTIAILILGGPMIVLSPIIFLHKFRQEMVGGSTPLKNVVIDFVYDQISRS